ncbi:MAG: BACON domain-containing protein [Odoribacter sp.]|nr:BACON domain-containing protein [Odoribacter sp.]
MKNSMSFFDKCRCMAMALVVCGCVLCGCHKHYHYYPTEVVEPETPAEAALTLSQENLTFSAEGGWKELMIDCTGEWIIAGGNEWCQPGATAGKGSTLLKIFVETSIETTERSAELSVKSGDQTQKLVVTQQGVMH